MWLMHKKKGLFKKVVLNVVAMGKMYLNASNFFNRDILCDQPELTLHM